jgi:hypothetical protein
MLSREELEQARPQRSRTIGIEGLRRLSFECALGGLGGQRGTFRLDRRLFVMR